MSISSVIFVLIAFAAFGSLLAALFRLLRLDPTASSVFIGLIYGWDLSRPSVRVFPKWLGMKASLGALVLFLIAAGFFAYEMRASCRSWDDILAILIGSILGALTVTCVLLVPQFRELSRRFRYARRGGVGETRDWGEPLFYIPLMAIYHFLPWGAIGAFVGGFVGWIIVT